METGTLYPELGEFVVQDALSERQNHADAPEGSPRNDEDVRCSLVIRRQAVELDERLHKTFG